MGRVELFYHLTVCKQMTDVEKQYLKPFNCENKRLPYLPSPPLGQDMTLNPSARAGYDTRSIFKQSLTGLNSEFSFS